LSNDTGTNKALPEAQSSGDSYIAVRDSVVQDDVRENIVTYGVLTRLADHDANAPNVDSIVLDKRYKSDVPTNYIVVIPDSFV
jgi:hypothetical protein